jgi:hypothetical protein
MKDSRIPMLSADIEKCTATRCTACGAKPSKGVVIWTLTGEFFRREFGLTDDRPRIVVLPLCRTCGAEADRSKAFRSQIQQSVHDLLSQHRIYDVVVVIADPDL